MYWLKNQLLPILWRSLFISPLCFLWNMFLLGCVCMCGCLHVYAHAMWLLFLYLFHLNSSSLFSSFMLINPMGCQISSLRALLFLFDCYFYYIILWRDKRVEVGVFRLLSDGAVWFLSFCSKWGFTAHLAGVEGSVVWDGLEICLLIF